MKAKVVLVIVPSEGGGSNTCSEGWGGSSSNTCHKGWGCRKEMKGEATKAKNEC